jgi:hypothetical protein
MRGGKKKKDYDHMSVTLGDKRPSHSPVKNLVVRFSTGYLNTEDEVGSGRTTEVEILENMGAIIP